MALCLENRSERQLAVGRPGGPPLRPSFPEPRTLIRLCLLALGLLVALPATAGAQRVELEDHEFAYVDADETTAFFRWSVDVVDQGGDGLRVRVILELLDEDDRVVNRDAQGRNSDVVTVTLEPGEGRKSVRQQGRIAYDRAANVVTSRVRWEIVEGH